LDELGYGDCALAAHLRPVTVKHCFAGWAMTISCRDMHYTPQDCYAGEIAAVDSIRPGEVVMVGTGKSARNAPWGELLSTAAVARGARGAIIDGLVRDVKKIDEIGFGVFAAGIKPVDSRGRGVVVEHNVPVECGGIVVMPGDLVFADYDGVVVVPQNLVAEVVRLASDKASRENSTRDELKRGAYLRDVFAKYGVL
jgi:regulator of RNase E activity RraA